MVVLRQLRNSRRFLAAAGMTAAALAAMVAGCNGPRHTAPPVDPSKLSDDAFLHYLAEVPVVTVDEGFRAMLILADGEDKCTNFEQRRDKLIGRHIARREWNLQPQNVIDRGSIAAMTCQICRIRGGINRIIFASWGAGDRRYATRELIYERLMDDGPDYSPIRGGELVALLTKADTFMEQNGVYQSKPVELGTEAEARRLSSSPASQPVR